MKKPTVINEPKVRLSVTLEEHIKISQGLNKGDIAKDVQEAANAE